MKTYKQLYSILDLNGEKVLVDMDKWAELTLNGPDKAQYNSDRNNDWFPDSQRLVESGDITTSAITETIQVDGTNIEIQIGLLFNVKDDYVYRPSFLYWQDRFSKDPNVTYKPDIYI
jgi:hypothetical protein